MFEIQISKKESAKIRKLQRKYLLIQQLRLLASVKSVSVCNEIYDFILCDFINFSGYFGILD